MSLPPAPPGQAPTRFGRQRYRSLIFARPRTWRRSGRWKARRTKRCRNAAGVSRITRADKPLTRISGPGFAIPSFGWPRRQTLGGRFDGLLIHSYQRLLELLSHIRGHNRVRHRHRRIQLWTSDNFVPSKPWSLGFGDQPTDNDQLTPTNTPIGFPSNRFRLSRLCVPASHSDLELPRTLHSFNNEPRQELDATHRALTIVYGGGSCH